MAALTLRLIRLSMWLLVLAPPALAADISLKLDGGAHFSVRNNTGVIERLRVDEATGNISRNGALFVHTTGIESLYVGANAGNLATDAVFNTAFGSAALQADTTGSNNSAFGRGALSSNTTGGVNAAFGDRVLRANTMGFFNSGFGTLALFSNTTGERNSAFGTYALFSTTTGNRNVAIGVNAGQYQTTGSDNIYLANEGVAAESGQIKIGTVGTHTRATVAGIHNSISEGGISVLVNGSGTLGTMTSSARFKEDVRDMADTSDVLMKLRPVTFRYREETVGGEAAKTTQYGLIAEEVAEVAPELVAPDAEGRPYSVKYHELPALLLNEVQEQQRTIEEQASRIDAQQHEMQDERREHQMAIAALTTRLAQLEARVISQSSEAMR